MSFAIFAPRLQGGEDRSHEEHNRVSQSSRSGHQTGADKRRIWGRQHDELMPVQDLANRIRLIQLPGCQDVKTKFVLQEPTDQPR